MRVAALTVVGFVLLAGCVGGSVETTDTEIPPVAQRPTQSADRDLDEALSPEREKSPQRQPVRRLGARHRVLDVIDGDTVKVAYRGAEVSVRVIGIGVRLVFDPSQGRTDAYGRTPAYLQSPGIGAFGLAMIRQGRAAEYTYDSAYARRARYQAAQSTAQGTGRGIWNHCGGVDTALAQPAPEAQPRPGGDCDPGYDPCVPPYPPDLDCDDVDGPIRITGDDPHGFDADADDVGCDS